MYSSLLKKLVEGKYSFCTCYDLILDHNEVYIETEDEDQILVYIFDHFGRLDRMQYQYGRYHEIIEQIVTGNPVSGEYSRVVMYTGQNKAKIKF